MPTKRGKKSYLNVCLLIMLNGCRGAAGLSIDPLENFHCPNEFIENSEDMLRIDF